MPNAIYQYVYYEPLAVGGPVTRQNRNPATSSKYLPVPGITVPPTNDLAPGSVFTPDTPPQSYTDGSGYLYEFGFMNVSGCAGAGETSTNYSNLPGSASFAPLIVGETTVINILVLYIIHGGGVGGPGGAGIYLDAFNETTGTFLDNFFVNNIAPDNTLTSNVNVYGSLAVEPRTETVQAAASPIHTTGVVDSAATFDKWVILEGDGTPVTNPSLSGNNLIVGASTASDIAAFAFYKDRASVYITGGYQSPDIILFSPFSPTSMGTVIPVGSGDTTVIAGTHYGFAANVHNGSEYEVSTKVTFWIIPGGLATSCVLLDTQTVTIAAGSSLIVYSSAPFVNAGGHTCAAVSIETDDSPCQFNPTSSADAVNIPDPTSNYTHSCSAWRNTDTIYVFPGEHIRFKIPLDHWGPVQETAIPVTIETLHVPVGWAQNEKVLKEAGINRRIYGKTQPYLIPALKKTLPQADLKTEVSLQSKGEIAHLQEEDRHSLRFADHRETDFNIAGTIPANAKPGDVFLLNITAHYPKAGRRQARAVEFLEILVVKAKK